MWTLPESAITEIQELSAQVVTIQDAVYMQKRLIGRKVDELIQEFGRYGHTMRIYEQVAFICSEQMRETIEPRTIRDWRESYSVYTTEDIKEFAPLSNAQLIAAVNLSHSDNLEGAVTPQYICEHALQNNFTSAKQMYNHWLPTTSTNGETDPGWISSIKRYVRHWPQNDPRHAELSALLLRLRALIEGKG